MHVMQQLIQLFILSCIDVICSNTTRKIDLMRQYWAIFASLERERTLPRNRNLRSAALLASPLWRVGGRDICIEFWFPDHVSDKGPGPVCLRWSWFSVTGVCRWLVWFSCAHVGVCLKGCEADCQSFSIKVFIHQLSSIYSIKCLKERFPIIASFQNIPSARSE